MTSSRAKKAHSEDTVIRKRHRCWKVHS